MLEWYMIALSLLGYFTQTFLVKEIILCNSKKKNLKLR